MRIAALPGLLALRHDEAGADRNRDGFDTAAGAEFFRERGNVKFDRVDGKRESAGDVGRGAERGTQSLGRIRVGKQPAPGILPAPDRRCVGERGGKPRRQGARSGRGDGAQPTCVGDRNCQRQGRAGLRVGVRPDDQNSIRSRVKDAGFGALNVPSPLPRKMVGGVPSSK